MKIISISRNVRLFRALSERDDEDLMADHLMGSPYKAVGEIAQDNLTAIRTCNRFINYHQQRISKEPVVRKFVVKPETRIL